MKTRRTLIFSVLVFVLGLSLLIMGSPGKANAGSLTQTEWESVADYLQGYVSSQYVSGPDFLGLGDGDNEYGFIYTPELYKSRVDTNVDGTVCGVGDDMVNRPVLVDNLISQTTLIPGTSLRNQWNNASTSYGGMSTAVLAAVKAKVDAHKLAGFSTDIAVY